MIAHDTLNNLRHFKRICCWLQVFQVGDVPNDMAKGKHKIGRGQWVNLLDGALGPCLDKR